MSDTATVMTFYWANQVSGEFTQSIGSVRDAFLAAMGAHETGCDQSGMCSCYDRNEWLLKLDYWPLERTLRDWLTSPQGFNSSWADEAAFSALYDSVHAELAA